MKETTPRPQSPEPTSTDLKNALDILDAFWMEHIQEQSHTHSLGAIQHALDIATKKLSNTNEFYPIASYLYRFGKFLTPDQTRTVTNPFDLQFGSYVLRAIAKNQEVIAAQIPHESNRFLALSLTELMVYKNTDYATSKKGVDVLHKYLPVVEQGIRNGDAGCTSMIPTYLIYVDDQDQKIALTIKNMMKDSGNIDQLLSIFHNLFHNKNYLHSSLLHEIGVENILLLLDRFHFTTQESRLLIKAWKESKPDDPLFMGNLYTIFTLESKEPGCTEYLMKEFGISCFARYPQSILLNQYRNRHDTKNPYGLVIYPHGDHNGAFYEDINIFESLERQFGNIAKHGPTYSIRIFECENLYSAGRAIVKSARNFGKIHFIVVGGHGKPTHLDFSEYEMLTKKQIHQGQGIQRVGKFFIPNPPVVLVSCSTGRRSGLAEELSRIGSGARVIGPRMPTHIKNITVTYTDNTLSLSASYEDANPTLYESGIVTQISS